MLVDDAVADRKPQSRPDVLGFGGEKRIKDAGDNFRTDVDAVVFHRGANPFFVALRKKPAGDFDDLLGEAVW